MLDVIVTCYDVEELITQYHIFKDVELPYKFHYITNNENKERIKQIKEETNLSIYWLDNNPGKHMGALYLASAGRDLITQPFVLHYHADMIFEQPSLMKDMFEDFKNSNCKVGGIPRQWCFDNEGIFNDNKSLPYRSELFFMTSELYLEVFDLTNFEKYKQKCLENKHPSLHFEPYTYAGLELNKVDFLQEIYYLEEVKRMKELYGNAILYYDTTFEKTKIRRLK
jgi:hypothetical protein